MTPELVTALNSLRDALNTFCDTLNTHLTAPPAPTAPTPAPVEAAPGISLPQVREVLANLSRAGKTEVVRELLRSVGADKLSGVDPTRYAELLAGAQNA